MYKVFEKHKKKLMAVFGVLLMIVFILPSSFSNTAPDRSYGTVGDQPLPLAEVAQASNEWKTLLENENLQNQIYQLMGPEFFFAAKDHPELWALLKRNALEMGFDSHPEELEADLAIQMPNATPSQRKMMARSLASLYQIRSAFVFAASMPKISQPRLNQTIATKYQLLKFSAIEFTAHARMDQVSQPTAAEIDQQLATYGNTPADQPTAENPFGYGYQFPARIKAQYLVIPRSEVSRAVQATKTDYQWDVEYNLYFQKHPQMFPTTAPAAPSVTEGATTAPASQPAVKVMGYSDYKEQVKEAVLRPLVDKQMQVIQDAISQKLQKGYQDATKDAKGATTQPSGPFTTFAYLQSIQKDIANTYKVTLTIHDEAKWHTQKSLEAQPVFGEAFQAELRRDNQGNVQPVKLPALQWLFDHAQPLAGEEISTAKTELPLFQASTVFRLNDGSLVMFRITDAHTPRAPLADEREQVLPRVIEDLRIQAAYELTLKTAQKLKDEGEKDGKSLVQIANTEGRNILSFGPIHPGFDFMGQRFPDSVEGINIPEEDMPLFVQQANDMLKLASEKNPHPIGVIQLQHQDKCLLVQLDSVTIQPFESMSPQVVAMQSLTGQERMALQESWFSPENIQKRMNFKMP